MKTKDIPLIPDDEASYMVVGWSESGGGILCNAEDEFTAHRYKKMYADEGYHSLRVAPIENEEFEAVHYEISNYIRGMG